VLLFFVSFGSLLLVLGCFLVASLASLDPFVFPGLHVQIRGVGRGAGHHEAIFTSATRAGS